MQMANPSKAVSGLFALSNDTDPITAGDRRRARHNRKKQLTAELGSAAANTQLAAEAQTEADRIASTITPKVEALATEHQLINNTAKQIAAVSATASATTSSPPSPLANPEAEDVALGQARMAQYYTQTAEDMRGTAQWWGPLIIVLTAIGALLWNWYHRKPYDTPGLTPTDTPDLSRPGWWKTMGIFVVLLIASVFPIEVMQLPRAAISPLMKLVSP